jgi:hypothetical protein
MALLVSLLPLSRTCAVERWHRQPGSSDISWSCGSSRWLYTPAVRSCAGIHQMRNSFSIPRGRHHFSASFLGIHQGPIQLGVLVLLRSRSLGLGHIHPADLRENDCASCPGPRLGPKRTSNWTKTGRKVSCSPEIGTFTRSLGWLVTQTTGVAKCEGRSCRY